tara:strand:+ start:28 stop:225 length:198 start_codon:yes stop_codon:yes gene_type:complete
MDDKLMDNIEALHKAVNTLAVLGVCDSEEIKELSTSGLDKLIGKYQVIIRNDAISYFAELDDTKK